MKYLPAWEGQRGSMLRFDVLGRSLARLPHIIGNDVPECISYVFGKENGAYYREDVFEHIKKEHGEYFLERSHIEALPRAYDAIIEEMEAFYADVRAVPDWKSMPDADLMNMFERYIERTERCTANFRSTREECETAIEPYIRRTLAKHYPLSEADDLFKMLTTSADKSTITDEREAWLEILRSEWNEESAMRYAFRFPANVANFYGDEIPAHLKERYKADTGRATEIEDEVRHMEEVRDVVSRRQREVFGRCNDALLELYARALQRFGLERFRLKHYFWGPELHMYPLLSEIMRRMNMSVADFFRLIQVEDVRTFLATGRMVSPEELSKRNHCVVIALEGRKLRYYSGERAERIVKRMHADDAQLTELKGRTAYPGFVRARARLVHLLDAAELQRLERTFMQGDILVTGNTDPSLVLLMKRSGAIVTHAGGVTSHAAIVSREYKIPCVVGVKDAMRSIRDGDMLEVDATHGVVRIIQPFARM